MPENNITGARMDEMRGLQKRLKKELQHFHMSNAPFWGASIDESVFRLLHTRMSSPGVRSYFLFKVAQYIQAMAEKDGYTLRACPDPNLFRTTIPFLAESIISVQYYHNQILDRKGGVGTPETIGNTLIAGNLLRSFLERYIESRVIDPMIAEKLLHCTSKIFELVDVAQFMDKNWGSYEAFTKGVPKNTELRKDIELFCAHAPLEQAWAIMQSHGIQTRHHDFTQLYLKRAWLANAPLLIILGELIMDTMGYSGKERAKVIQFASEYGLLVQLTNDTIDLLPPETVDKGKQDSFSDLKNGTVSLPYLFYFNFHPDQDLKTLQRRLRRNEAGLLRDFLPLIDNVCIPVVNTYANAIGAHIDLTYGELLQNMRTMGTEDNKYFRRYKGAFAGLPKRFQKRYTKLIPD